MSSRTLDLASDRLQTNGNSQTLTFDTNHTQWTDREKWENLVKTHPITLFPYKDRYLPIAHVSELDNADSFEELGTEYDQQMMVWTQMGFTFASHQTYKILPKFKPHYITVIYQLDGNTYLTYGSR